MWLIETVVQLKKVNIFFCSKIAVYLYLGLLKGRPSYRTLQKKKIPHFLDPRPDPDPLT